MNSTICTVLIALSFILTACSESESADTNQSKEENQEGQQKSLKETLMTFELFNEEKTLQESAASGKPILLYFTGHAVVGSRKMEERILSDPEIVSAIEQEYIFKALYCDDKTELPKDMQGEVQMGNSQHQLKDIGDFHIYYEYTQFERISQPLFVIMNDKGKVLATADYRDSNLNDFKAFLKKGLGGK